MNYGYIHIIIKQKHCNKCGKKSNVLKLGTVASYFVKELCAIYTYEHSQTLQDILAIVHECIMLMEIDEV